MRDNNITLMRDRITKLRIEARQLEHGVPLPKADAIARIEGAIDALSERGAETLATAAQGARYERGVIDLARMADDGSPLGALEILALVDAVALKKKASAAVNALYSDGPEGLSTKDRSQRLAEIERETLQAEADEYRAVEEARAAGANIEHRADIDPRVLLGLVEVAA